MGSFTLPDGVRLFVSDRGAGRPVVLLHGWGTSGQVWEGQVVALHERARLITPDLRGCGQSDHPAHGNTVAEVAGDVLALLIGLELEEVVLVGSSLGGNVALEAALTDASRLSGLVLVDSPQHFFADGIDKDAFWTWHASLRKSRPEVFQTMVRSWFGPQVGADTATWTADLLLRSGWFIDDLLADAATHDRRDDLGRLTLPVALFHGRLDPEVPMAIPNEAAGLLPSASVVVFEDAAHMPHLEVPERFNAELRRFLDYIEHLGA